MTDILTKLLEWGLGIIILGFVVFIGVSWFFKIKNQLQGKIQGKKQPKKLNDFFKEVKR